MTRQGILISTIAISSVLLFGCATAKTITGPDGTEHQLITCDSIDLCYEKATELCGKYKIVDRSNEISGASMINSTAVAHNSSKLLVKCEAN